MISYGNFRDLSGTMRRHIMALRYHMVPERMVRCKMGELHLRFPVKGSCQVLNGHIRV
jgi:hypothetical protein